MGRAARTARICHSAWTPAPITVSVSASGRARSRVPTPEAAPVRMAVTAAPSSSARGCPVLASNQTTSAWIVGNPRSALPGMTVTSLTVAPSPPARTPGMRSSEPSPSST